MADWREYLTKKYNITPEDQQAVAQAEAQEKASQSEDVGGQYLTELSKSKNELSDASDLANEQDYIANMARAGAVVGKGIAAGFGYNAPIDEQGYQNLKETAKKPIELYKAGAGDRQVVQEYLKAKMANQGEAAKLTAQAQKEERARQDKLAEQQRDQANRDREFALKSKEINQKIAKDALEGTDLPKEKRLQIEDLAKDSSGKLAIKNSLAADLEIMKKHIASGNTSQAVQQGRSMLKTLNSEAGKDAIGAEEAKRIGGLLEYQMFNLTNPGPMFGRDVNAFVTQVDDKIKGLDQKIKYNESSIAQIKGQPVSQVRLSNAAQVKVGASPSGTAIAGQQAPTPVAKVGSIITHKDGSRWQVINASGDVQRVK